MLDDGPDERFHALVRHERNLDPARVLQPLPGGDQNFRKRCDQNFRNPHRVPGNPSLYWQMVSGSPRQDTA